MVPGRADRHATRVEDADAVRSLLRRLPPGQRAVLVLRFLCDMSIDDTAVVLRCSAGNVKAQTSRGLESLREVMGTTKTATERG